MCKCAVTAATVVNRTPQIQAGGTGKNQEVKQNEDDISAKEAFPRQGTRLPQEDADIEWQEGVSQEKGKGKT